MRPSTSGGSLPRSSSSSTPSARPFVASNDLSDALDEEQSRPTAATRRATDGELTQLLRQAMADGLNGSQPLFPGSVAVAMPAWKRGLDLAIVAITLPVWLPLMILIALWVAVTSPGPVFYRQPRIGLNGRRFMIVKFRTMKVNAETRSHETYLEQLMVSDKPMVKLDATGDPRLILGGKLLRAVGLDELPQIFNVVRGEMSVVGPRPCTVREFELYTPEDRQRVKAVPGLTGLWQVNGKNRTTFRQMIDLDVFYAENISVAMDLKIIARTLPVIASQLLEMCQTLQRSGAQSSSPPVTNANG